jgi:hypothetical protein
MPSTVEDTASCALCRRHLLVGEPARLYQDPQSKRFAKVCPLCYERADRRGWRAEGRPIVAVHANPPSDHLLRERESLIDRLPASCSRSSSTSTGCARRWPRPSSRRPSCAASSVS